MVSFCLVDFGIIVTVLHGFTAAYDSEPMENIGGDIPDWCKKLIPVKKEV